MIGYVKCSNRLCTSHVGVSDVDLYRQCLLPILCSCGTITVNWEGISLPLMESTMEAIHTRNVSRKKVT